MQAFSNNLRGLANFSNSHAENCWSHYEELGSRQQALGCPRAARHAAVRYSSTSLPWGRRLVIAVNIRSTNRLPLSLCVPNDFRLHITARRNGLSALLLVGSTHSSRTKVHIELVGLAQISPAFLVGTFAGEVRLYTMDSIKYRPED